MVSQILAGTIFVIMFGFIITETNKLIYLTHMDKVYEYPYDVKNIKHNENKITIIFRN